MGFKSVFRVLVAATAVFAFTAAPAIDARTGPTSAVAPQNVKPASCTPGQKACPIRINFASGAYSGQASSTLANINSKKWFVVNLHKNQEVTMWVIGGGATGSTRGFVYRPNGQPLAGGPGGRIYDDTAPATGDYLIKATESPMGEQWSGRVTVLVVAI